MKHKKLLSLLVLLMTTVSMSASVPNIQISVTVPTGNSITLKVTPDNTIGVVKDKIQTQTLIPSELQILTFNNQVLEDTKYLSDYDIRDDAALTLSLVSGNYYLNGGSTQNCPVSFKVGNNDNAGTAPEGEVVTVTFTPTAPYVLTAITAQAYTTWAGARRAEQESTPTIPVLGDIKLTPVEGQANTYTFTMPPSHVKFTPTLLQSSGLAWTLSGNKLADGATVNYCKGFPFTAPVLVNPNGLDYQFEVEGASIYAGLDPNLAVTVDDRLALPGTYTFTATFDGDETYQATTVKFDLVISEPAILSVAAYPTTGGTVEVVIPESGVIANQDGTYSVVPGTSVTLKATAAKGYQLNSWSNNVTADTDDNTVATITVNETATATANFGAKEYEVDLTVNGDDDQGTEKALWTGKAGEQGTAANFPITAKTGQAVTISYNGRRKVKSVKAVLVPTYLKWDATKKEWVEEYIPATATPVENADDYVEWEAGTYLVEGNVTINGEVTLSDDVELIIKDGAKLTANHIFGDKHNLNIYGQADKSGELNVACSGSDAIKRFNLLNIHSCKVNASSLFVTCGGFCDIGEFNLYGGSVDAKYTSVSSGYGLYDISSLNIWGGEMKAEGKGTTEYSYGISCLNSVTNVTVYGGKLWVKADTNALDPTYKVTFTKDPSYDGKIETSNDGEYWDEYTDEGKPDTKYVRVGY